MPNTVRNKTTRADRIRKVLAGLTAHFGSTNIVLGGTSYKPAALQTFLQADVDANDASTKAKAQWMTAVQAAKSTDSATDIVLQALEGFVRSQFRGAPNEAADLADFGWKPRTRAPLTAAQKAAAASKARATRAARGTKGPKAKLAIKGTVPATPAEPTTPAPTPAAAASSSASPSPSASPNGVVTAANGGASHS
jgi:hypothetical protein